MTIRRSVSALVGPLLTLYCASSIVAEEQPQRGTRDFDLSKFEKPESWVLKERSTRGGPGGTDWDNPYRSLIQTSAKAESKGFPSHNQAVKMIIVDAQKNSDNLEKHLYWTLFIKHFSSKYRPEEATVTLRKLYTTLVDIKHGGQVKLGEAKKIPFAGRKGLTIHRDVIYGNIDPDQQNLDAYMVTSDQPTPVLIELHGGGWRRGKKNRFGSYPEGLFEKLFDVGISVVSTNYRLIPKYPFPASEEDAVRAVQFVRSKAKDWNINPDRIAVMGGSAGAHLSLWVGLSDDLARPNAQDPMARLSSRVACIVDFSGPVDMLRFEPKMMKRMGTRGEDMSEIFPGKFGYDLTRLRDQQDPEVLQAMKRCSPIHFVSADDPPVLVVHQAPQPITGAEHSPVPKTIQDPHSFWHGVLLADAIDEAGGSVQRHIGPHGGRQRENCDRVVQFIVKYLKTE